MLTTFLYGQDKHGDWYVCVKTDGPQPLIQYGRDGDYSPFWPSEQEILAAYPGAIKEDCDV